MINSVVMPCVCQHAFQDKEYGRGKRLHNPVKKGGKSEKEATNARCTVCGSEKTIKS